MGKHLSIDSSTESNVRNPPDRRGDASQNSPLVRNRIMTHQVPLCYLVTWGSTFPWHLSKWITRQISVSKLWITHKESTKQALLSVTGYHPLALTKIVNTYTTMDTSRQDIVVKVAPSRPWNVSFLHLHRKITASINFEQRNYTQVDAISLCHSKTTEIPICQHRRWHIGNSWIIGGTGRINPSI